MVEKIVILSINQLWNRVSKAFLSNEPIELLYDGTRVLSKAHSKVSLGFLQLAGHAWNTLVISVRGVSLQGTVQRLQNLRLLLRLSEHCNVSWR